MSPETRYVKSDDVHIAYQALGDGPIDILFVPGFVSNVEANWQSPQRSAFFQRLASFCRLILFDKRGTGMSDRGSQIFTLEALAAMRATKTIPLVMMVSGFPVEAGIVPSLAHPGGNITGMRTHTDELPGKWMELLRELVPALRVVGSFDDYVPPFSNEAEIEAGYRVMVRSAEGMGIELRRWRVSGDAALARALAEAEHANIDVLWFTNGAVHTAPPNVERIREFVVRRRLPMASDLVWGSLFKNAGAVMAYSAAWDEIVERTASFVDRILRGAQAGDLPVEQPTRFELVVNLGVAKAIGVTIPRSLLVRADRVIE
jgi:putative ABC transport system substrate-binding protein